MEVRWSTAANSGPVLVGFSQGRGAPDPGSRVLTSPFDSGPASTALRLSLPNLPLLGTTAALVSDRLPDGAVVGFQLLSFVGFPAGLSAAGYGMSGCSQYVAPDVTLLLLAAGGTMVAPLALPADPAFEGADLFGQSLCLSPGANALGVIASNGLRLHLGQ